jgi:molybdenum cofactor synthesis domain-containing protein
MRAVVITVSDSRAAGEAEDESGARLAEFAESLGAEIVGRETVPDEQRTIEERLRHWADSGACDLILTTGGTGFAPRDVTPEATRAVIEREAPGIAEAMRSASREHTRLWMVSRGAAGDRGRTLIVNFPGAPKSIAEAGEGIREALPHAVKLLRGERH